MRIRASQRIAVVAIVAAAGLLAGCTPSPEPAPSGIATTPGPSPIPSAVAPGSRVPVTCDELVPAALRETLLGPDARRSGALPYLVIQGGGLECRWQDGDVSLQVSVLADAEEAFGIAMVERYGARPSGDEAGSCHDPDDFRRACCELTGLVDGYWYEISGDTLRVDEGAPAQQPLLEAVRGALAVAGPPPPAWAPPSSATVFGPDCETFDTPAFRAVVGSEMTTAPTPEIHIIASEAARRAGQMVCFWYAPPNGIGSFAHATVQGLPGSGWAWEAIAHPEVVIPGVPVDVEGADAALVRCFGESCSIDVLVGGTAFRGRLQRYDEVDVGPETMVAAAEAWVAALR